MWTGESQSVGESVLIHDGFFLKSFGIEFHDVAKLETRSARIVFLVDEVLRRHVWCILFG